MTRRKGDNSTFDEVSKEIISLEYARPKDIEQQRIVTFHKTVKIELQCLFFLSMM